MNLEADYAEAATTTDSAEAATTTDSYAVHAAEDFEHEAEEAIGATQPVTYSFYFDTERVNMWINKEANNYDVIAKMYEREVNNYA